MPIIDDCTDAQTCVIGQIRQDLLEKPIETRVMATVPTTTLPPPKSAQVAGLVGAFCAAVIFGYLLSRTRRK